MAVRQFDELKSIRKELDLAFAKREIEKYFDEMELPKSEIEKRIRIAYDFQNFFVALFSAILLSEDSREQYISRIQREYTRICDKYDLRVNEPHINRLAETIVDNTMANIDTEWYTSTDRTIKIAETETNNSANYTELQEAKENGYTSKTWVTMNDNKVRATHRAVDGMTIGIDETFMVGNAEMRFPCDEEMAFEYPEELANCRCILTYS